MKNLLRLEELAQFLICLLLLAKTAEAWWVYPLLVLGPDIGMLGYLAGPRVGAITYNGLHHKGIALLVLVAGALLEPTVVVAGDDPGQAWLLAGLILYGHASMDRIFGYGLKFGDSFHHTHLGWIGKRVASSEAEVGK